MLRYFFFCLSAVFCGSVMAGQHAIALGNCIYENTSSTDKDTLTQWAFITLGKTDAVRKVAIVPEKTNRMIDTKAQSLVKKITLGVCRNQMLAVAMREPKNGLQDAVSHLANRMIQNQIELRASQLISLDSMLGANTNSDLKNLGHALENFLR